MSVVEKESPVAVGLEGIGRESISNESSSAIKVTRGAIAPMSGAKSSRPVLYRESRAATPTEIKSFISSRSDALQQFVAPLEEVVRKSARLRARPVATTRKAMSKVAEVVLEVIRRIAHRETGIYSMEPNVSLFLSAVYAGSVEGAIVAGLVRRAQAVQDAVSADVRDDGLRSHGADDGALAEYDVNRELDELTMLLKWYVKRKMSLTGLEVAQSRKAELSLDGVSLAGEEDDALFAFEVMHDHQVFATKGCFVSCGLRLIGHDGQLLWLRVSARRNAAPIAVRPEWSTWTDPNMASAAGEGEEHSPFCSLVPIRPQAQRLVIDDIRAFVPYSALDLPEGRCDIELHIAVVDSEGREILSATKPESICIPQQGLSSFSVPSPHSIVMWPHDVVSGDRISDLRLSSGYKVIAGWERHTVSVQCDLALFMHAGESLLFECRFLDGKGNPVELSSLGIPYVAGEVDGVSESVSSFRYRRVLHPKGAWAQYRGVCLDVPVEFLLLEAGHHNLTCEVVVVSQDDQIVCGDIGVVSVHVPGRKADASEIDRVDVAEGAAEFCAEGSWIGLQSLEIDPTASFNGVEGVRIEARFVPKDASRQIADLASGRVGELFTPYRVEVSVERGDGHLLIQAFSDALGMSFKPVTRGVCVDGRAGIAHHAVATHFSKEDLLGWSFGSDEERGVSKIRLFAVVRALSLSGEELVRATREFYVKPLVSGQPRLTEVGLARPRIVDASATIHPQRSTVSCRIVLNVPRGRVLDQGFVLAGVLHVGGKRVGEAVRYELADHRRAAWSRPQSGLSQIDYECEIDAGPALSDDIVLVATLIDPSHEVVQTVRQGVQQASVLLDSEGDRADHDHSADEEGSQPQSHQNRRRGLFSWFKS